MFTLKSLPYEKSALNPHMSEETVNLHYGKHHQGYVDKLNNLITDTEFAKQSLEEIIINTHEVDEYKAIHNNAGQAYNHDIFWQSLTPNEDDREMSERLVSMINRDFDSLDNFHEKFKQAAVSVFGSGWVWLVEGADGLEIVTTANGHNPLPFKLRILLGLDVWEHAYYLDYQNRRGDFVEEFLNHLANWKFADSNLSQ